MPRLPRSSWPDHQDPRQSHPFLETNDSGLGAAASGSAFRMTNVANVLGVTTAFLRSTRCAVPGCGRERHDPIHAPSDAD